MSDQQLVFLLISSLFVAFTITRFRYDVVSIVALAIANIIGIVPNSEVFSGFGHPAVVIVALVLVVSRGLTHVGAIQLITSKLIRFIYNTSSHIGIMGSIAALLSSFINNIAALAILMPADISLNKKFDRSPSSTLMPLSFASILGGMVTLIGTAPNVVIATLREDYLGSAYSMFDFAYVGLIVAVSGILFISLIGWKLVPQNNNQSQIISDATYTANAKVSADSDILNLRVSEVKNLADEYDICILEVIRSAKIIGGNPANQLISEEDTLILEGSIDNIDQFIVKTNTIFKDTPNNEKEVVGSKIAEVVVPPESKIIGKTALSEKIYANRGVSLLGISRGGQSILSHIRGTKIKSGDVLLLQGRDSELNGVIDYIGGLRLEDKEIKISNPGKAWKAMLIFIMAITLSSINFVYLPVALIVTIVAYLILGILPANVAYQSVSWRIIILLGSMIPIGNALITTGGAETISQEISSLTIGMDPVIVLIIILIVTMTLSDILNNVATVLIIAPISISLAQQLGVNPDAFLMAVAVGASCAFLTPIGHQNNSLILGPGGYKFSDYWKLGFPLEIVVILTSVPAILFFWPL